jgi:P27 family predicted phage terminase small subunit
MRGRKPKPTTLKLLEGNPGKRPLNHHEPQPASDKPTCPSHLSGEARKEWNRISKDLHQAGLLTRIDKTALAIYCQAWQRWVEAEENLKKVGPVVKSPSGYPVLNPFWSVANKAMSQMQKALVEFGMTPSSRSRINLAESGGDALEDFIKSDE